MYPNHDWKSRRGGPERRSSDVQIQTFEFVLMEDLSGDINIWKPNKVLFETLLIWLGAYWAEG